MCIYSNISIIHYFTIFKLNEKYYLNSSYGSNNVCVPQYTTRLNKSEFNNFCRALPKKNVENIKHFFEKYFLKKKLKIKYNDNILNTYESLRAKWIDSTMGVNKEINSILISSKIFNVGWLMDYKYYIQELL